MRCTHHFKQLFVTVLTVLAFLTFAAQAQESQTWKEWLDWADARIQEVIDIPDDQRTYENTIGALDDMLARLEIETTFYHVMAYLSPVAQARELGNEVAEAKSAWFIDLGLNEDLYLAIKAYADTNPPLTGEKARLLKFMLRDYRRAGMELPPEKREELKEVQLELSKLSIEFPRNIREDETTTLLTAEELAGMPDDFLEGLERSADLYIVGMDGPTVMRIWMLCPSETTRKKVWVAYKREGGQKNVALFEKILKLRAKAASLLGYRHSADFQTEILMTKNADTVKAFYDQVRPLVRKKSDLDFAQLRDAKREDLGDPDADFFAWDYWYYENLLKKRDYTVDTEKIREYFPLEQVTEGMFDVFSTLFGINFVNETEKAKAEGLPFWHEDVVFYRTYDKASGEMLGEVYIDFHPRPNKASGAFQWGFMPRKVWLDGSITKPRAVVQCNFTKPTADKPSLLSHEEVTTLFHEFGHFLHTVLTEATTSRFSGTSTERDFVELPSQMYENWCWDADVLRTFALHYETGEPLPDELLEGMLAARQFASGMLAERQFYYGMIDQAFNLLQPGEDIDSTQITLDLQDEVEKYDGVEGTYVHAGFHHLTNYIASYYGYQWSLVYSCDCFQIFEEMGLMNPEAGMKFRKAILSRGGTVDGMDMLRNFLGREPQMDAYLKHLGLETGSSSKVADYPGEPVKGDPVVTDSGLMYYDIVVGEGAMPTDSSTVVRVHYTGYFTDGNIFDSSVDRGQPINFALNRVIKGWTEGVGSMRIGGKRKLIIPHQLAYGERGRSGIPPKSTLIFDVELLDIVSN